MEEEERIQQLRQTIAEYAKARAEQDHLDEFKKSKLALLMKEYEAQGVSAVNAQEREARADERYIQVLKGLQEATETAERLRWELKLKEMQFDMWREKQWNRRAERKRYEA